MHPRAFRRSSHRLAALSPALRGAALMPAAALAVHQLRYALAYGGGASHALAAQGHAYLSSLTPWIVLLAGLALGGSLGALVQRWGRGGDGAVGAAGWVRAARLRAWLLARGGHRRHSSARVAPGTPTACRAPRRCDTDRSPGSPHEPHDPLRPRRRAAVRAGRLRGARPRGQPELPLRRRGDRPADARPHRPHPRLRRR